MPGRAQESPQVHPDDEAVDVQQQRSAALPHRALVQQVHGGGLGSVAAAHHEAERRRAAKAHV